MQNDATTIAYPKLSSSSIYSMYKLKYILLMYEKDDDNLNILS